MTTMGRNAFDNPARCIELGADTCRWLGNLIVTGTISGGNETLGFGEWLNWSNFSNSGIVDVIRLTGPDVLTPQIEINVPSDINRPVIGSVQFTSNGTSFGTIYPYDPDAEVPSISFPFYAYPLDGLEKNFTVSRNVVDSGGDTPLTTTPKKLWATGLHGLIPCCGRVFMGISLQIDLNNVTTNQLITIQFYLERFNNGPTAFSTRMSPTIPIVTGFSGTFQIVSWCEIYRTSTLNPSLYDDVNLMGVLSASQVSGDINVKNCLLGAFRTDAYPF
jgi:hypothetical protein